MGGTSFRRCRSIFILHFQFTSLPLGCVQKAWIRVAPSVKAIRATGTANFDSAVDVLRVKTYYSF
jgi:hypothetical protein